MTRRLQVFHSSGDNLRSKLHVVLVRPEVPQNVGAVARAMENMGIRGHLAVVGSGDIALHPEAARLARHATPRLEGAKTFDLLTEALTDLGQGPRPLSIAATARGGSPARPHPVEARIALKEATDALRTSEASEIILVFGPESDGLSNDDIECCDWLATVPTAPEYRSLNLAQSVLLFSYELHHNLLQTAAAEPVSAVAEHRALTGRFVALGADAGFILPGDPHKMRRRLRKIFESLPASQEAVRTLHGYLDQVERTLRTGQVEYKGRYKHRVEQEEPNGL